MIYDDLIKELKEDLSFNETNLSDKLSNLPVITTKWTDRLIVCKVDINKMINFKYKVIKRSSKYYNGKSKHHESGKLCPFTLSEKEIREVWIPADNDVINIKEKIDQKQKEIDFLDHAVKQCNDVRWTIKSFIDWERYRNGAM